MSAFYYTTLYAVHCGLHLWVQYLLTQCKNSSLTDCMIVYIVYTGIDSLSPPQTYTNPATPGGGGYDNPATPSPLIAESPQSSGSSHFTGSRYGTATPMYTDYMTPSPGTISPLTPGSDFSPRTPGSPMESGE